MIAGCKDICFIAGGCEGSHTGLNSQRMQVRVLLQQLLGKDRDWYGLDCE